MLDRLLSPLRLRKDKLLKFLTDLGLFISVLKNSKIVSKKYPFNLKDANYFIEANENFNSQFADFSKKLKESSREFKLRLEDQYPCLDDVTNETNFDRHYVYHPAWAARLVEKFKPKKHIDISSILAFSTILSAFIPVEFYDYRPAKIKLSNLLQGSIDLMNLHFESNSLSSLSCMHVIEHIGLGRYGDPLNPDGDIKAAEELTRVLAIGGQLLVVLPVGRSRIEFNAHRIYYHEQVIALFKELELVEYALIPDGEVEDGLIYSPTAELINAQSYGCGCYAFTKKAS
ncbi:DUF268 domain-containing protein [Polynucleobacter paneuropaeus]|nr:DUF268 domain-containing protein [Polynucleobacter paneuropaeus]